MPVSISPGTQMRSYLSIIWKGQMRSYPGVSAYSRCLTISNSLVALSQVAGQELIKLSALLLSRVIPHQTGWHDRRVEVCRICPLPF